MWDANINEHPKIDVKIQPNGEPSTRLPQISTSLQWSTTWTYNNREIGGKPSSTIHVYSISSSLERLVYGARLIHRCLFKMCLLGRNFLKSIRFTKATFRAPYFLPLGPILFFIPVRVEKVIKIHVTPHDPLQGRDGHFTLQTRKLTV